MVDSFISTAFAHSAWATERLLRACEDLSPEQLERPVPGTFGSILETLRHLVEDEAFSVFVVDDDAPGPPETAGMTPHELLEVSEATGTAWAAYLAREPDYGAWRREVDDADGFTRDATVAIRLAQQLHHSSEHRTQVCIGLSPLGIEPPKLDVFTYGVETDSVREWMPGDEPG